MKKENAEIICSIFQKHEPVIKSITDKINQAIGVTKKAIFAEKLQKEVDVFLSCSDYNDKNSDCNNCRFIAGLRKKTANLIIKTKKLV
jgi:hypothetical protein